MHRRAMDFYVLMNARRSVRAFAPDAIPDEILELAIRTAGTAPSGANLQPWHFCVVTSPEVRRELRAAVEAEEKENYERRFSEEMKNALTPLQTDFSKPYLTDAPALIVVFKENFRVVDGIRRKNYYVNESVGIACGLLITALHQAGLATVTHTPNPMKFLNDMLGRPANETPVMVLPVGYPAEGCTVPDNKRKKPAEIMTWI
ncbi:MAG: nitroreductase family protein [Balneolales bacterium]|nr:nitroreductase family protein [Balneolales bacterium]